MGKPRGAKVRRGASPRAPADPAASERLRRVIEAVGHPVRSATGDDYLRELVVHLSRELGVRYALIGELRPDKKERVFTIAMAESGKSVPPLDYELAGTPCESVFGGATCVYHTGVRELFPRDKLLVTIGADSYVGAPLRGADGAVLGLLTVLDDKALSDTSLVTAVLELYAVRAGAELERRHHESSLRRLQRLVLAAERVGRSGSFEWDLATGKVQWSPGMYDLYGVDATTVKEMTSELAMSFVNREDVAAIEAGVRAALEGGPPVDVQYRILRPDRNERIVSGYGEIFSGITGAPERMVGVVLDQTDRSRTETALRESEQRYRSLVEHATIGIYRSTIEGKFLFVNRALVAMLGYESEAELLSADLARDIYLNPDDRARLLREYAEVRVFGGIDVQWRRKDGAAITVRLSGASRRGPLGLEGFDVIAEDVTQRRVMEGRLVASQRMEAVGRLAGGIAHDLNNVLTAVRGYADLLVADMPADDERRSDAKEIKAATDRAASLTHQLLAFSRQQVLAPRVLDVNATVVQLDQMLKRIISEDITRVMTLEAMGRVRADPTQLEQVIMNLVVNARDAMPRGGRLEIRTYDAATLTEPIAGVSGTEGPFVVLEVKDSGVGMDGATLARIFEPFFTTKPMGAGTGLGLATAYGIVKQSGGYIFASSEPGKGSRFTVFLPRVDGTLEWPVQMPALARPLTGNESVLVVEDDANVRRVLTESLKRLGYRILEAQDGTEALALAGADPGQIHLLLTDVIMPGIAGPDLALQLKAVRPDVRVLLISGYAGDALLKGGPLELGSHFLAKPFTTTELASAVRDALDA